MHIPSADGATPAMAQWFAVKAAQPDALLFFRMGDFYEMFFGDAEQAAAALDIALTHRGEHGGRPVPMCGVPIAAADAYLARLIRRGFRVAVCEQMEPAKSRVGKAPLRREVVRLVTPGTLTEDTLLDPTRPNLLMAVIAGATRIGAAWLEISTGLFETTALSLAELPALLGRLDPAEILADPSLDLADWSARRAPETPPRPAGAARQAVAEAFGAASLEAFGAFTDPEAIAAAAALDYVRATQAGTLPRLKPPVPTGAAGTLAMDSATHAGLELIRARDGGADHTLLAAVRRTTSAAGARLLAGFVAAPLTDVGAIEARQDGWTWMLRHPDATATLRQSLRGAPDLARALGRLSVARGGPRDLAAVRDALAAAISCAELLTDGLPAGLEQARADLTGDTLLHDLSDLLVRALADPVPARLDDGAVIAAGFDGELDAHRRLRDDSRQHIARLQLDYAQRYGVAALKIRHHQQLGYVIEAPAVAVEKLRENKELVLRQGMANGARFTHPELSDLDRRIAEAADHAAARERTVFTHLVTVVLEQAGGLAAIADALALVDVLQSCARLAEGGAWCRPTITDDDRFRIREGRHPVVEAALAANRAASAAFVPNDCDLSADRRVLLLTGPNMAGKSTFLRQNALFVVLAQAGLPVPARSAEIGVVDRLFSRVGAADDLARGRSTFMVEMTETAAILHQATDRSLVVVDEIGRGTSTLDGLAIAWAVLEALHSQVRCRTIFATHFHELGGLAGELPRLSPHTMRVKEWQGRVVFLHEVAKGAAGRSWGVHVAGLAGVPAPVVRRAGVLLHALEKTSTLTAAASLPLFAAAEPQRDKSAEPQRDKSAEPQRAKSAEPQRDEFAGPPQEPTATEDDPIHRALADIDPDQLSPRDALEIIYRLQALLRAATPHETLS
jgi:DNA mismatch repair protein MutS